jgi:endonuclease/exonuclease/phosphatase family metal-dependent hydrolase
MRAPVRRLFGYVLHTLDALFLAACFGAYVARYVHPSWFWWLQLFAVALPFLAVALVPITVVTALARRWRLFALHLVLVVLFAFRVSPFPRTSEPGEGLGLLTYNLGQLVDVAENRRTEAFLEIVDREAADLYVFQDVLVRYRRREQRIVNYPALDDRLKIAGVAPRAAIHRVETTFLPVWAREERVSLLHAERLKMDTEDSLSMGITRVQFRWGGREAVLYNIHLRTFGERKPWNEEGRQWLSLEWWRSYVAQYREAFLVRARESDILRGMIAEERLPVIVAGDFNSTVHNWSYRRIAEGLTDAYLSAGAGFGHTYHARYPFARIDHVLVSSDWEVRRAEVGTASISDHRPLRVVLGWKE